MKPSSIKATYYVYIVRCSDGSLYAGIATNLDRRIEEHNTSAKGARYTKARRPVELVKSWPFAGRSAASKEEARIKRMSRAEKLAMIGQ